jgi:signal transduction histidine kinase/ActR/RegA family two-component response regulator
MTPSSSLAEAATHHRDSIRQEILAGQVRLLFGNANLGVAATLVAATILARLEWPVSPHWIILLWWLYMSLVSVARLLLASRYWRTAPLSQQARKWGTAYAIAAGSSGVGWGAAGVLLYPETDLAHQVFLVFILGGTMLGAVSILAPWPAAFFALIVPTGLAPTLRLLGHGDEVHVAMGLLAGVFTLAILITARQIHQTIVSSLTLQFENRDLLEDLQAAKNHADALNAQLEVRVQERTAELQRSSEQLRAETAQRQQVEDELLRARKLESLSVLAGGIAHDFNNFLTVVQGNIELAKRDLPPDSPVQEVLDQTASACRRGAFLSSQLLTFAKGGAPVRRLYSVARLVMDAVHLARAGAQTSIDVNISDDLWFAEVDPSQIGQVLHNILLNARQAMPEGGIIEVRAENILKNAPSPDPRVKITIRDYGHGIPADVLPRVFDPYFTTKPGGSGLGLATAYAIIEKHGGTLSVESKPGGGTLFTIDLPASQERPAETGPESPTVAHAHTGTERILIMDDEEALRKLLKTVLTTLGYEVHAARDGAEAIALCEHAKASGRGFDAVLLDLTVSGGMGGVEAAAKLKELDPSLKLIVSSGYSHAPVMADFRQYGFDAIIPKPWAIAELSKVLSGVLTPDPDRNATA